MPDLPFIIACGGHGKVQFALQSQFFLRLFPDLKNLICIGVCGGLSPQLQVGDLVVVEKVIEHDYKIKFSSATKLPEFPTDAELVMVTEKELTKLGLNYHKGFIASGDEDIIEPQRAEEVFNQTKALAVTWESAGGARGAQFTRRSYFELRAVSDLAFAPSPRDFAKNLERGMKTLAFVLANLSLQG